MSEPRIAFKSLIEYVLDHMGEGMLDPENEIACARHVNPEDVDAIYWAGVKALIGRDPFHTPIAKIQIGWEYLDDSSYLPSRVWAAWGTPKKSRKLFALPRRTWPWFYLAAPNQR